MLGASVGKNRVAHGAEDDNAYDDTDPQHDRMQPMNILAHRRDAWTHIEIDGEHDLRNDQQQQCAQATHARAGGRNQSSSPG